MHVDDVDDIAAGAAAVGSMADLARVLRALRRREARRRGGPELTLRQIAKRTGWSLAVVGEYLTGVRLASVERFDELVRLLGASAAEQGVLASARERAAASRRTDAEPESGSAGVPRMLPARLVGFVGRAQQLADLDALLAERDPAGTVVISALAGMGGVGKTALAVHWAHRCAESFPDGQLYVNLRGYDPAEPLTAMQALGVLLTGLGVAPTATPVDVAGRVAMYHRLVGQRRMLVVLDNAAGVDQVRPLLPPPTCLALVTSRDDLAELVASDGARRLTLDVLAEHEAVALLRPLVGPRADREPDAVRALARACGHLPLALRVAAEQAAFRPTVSVSDLVGELRTGGGSATLDELGTAGDVRADVRTVFSWSLRRLAGPAARAFRLLGLVPGSDIDGYGLAALTGADLAQAGSLAETLVRAHLIQPEGQGRFSMHDLVKAYAIELAERDLAPDDRQAATTRLLDHYLTTATTAVDIQFPYGKPIRPRNRPTPWWDGPTPDVTTVRSAGQWLAAECENLVRTCVHAARGGWPGHAIALASVLRPFFDNGHDDDGLTVHTQALHAAQRLGAAGDPWDHAFLHFSIAVTNWDLGRIDVAASHAQRAFDEYSRLDDSEGMSLGLIALSLVCDAEGRYGDAVECKVRGLALARAAGNEIQEGAHLHNLGWDHIRLEEYAAAADYYRQAQVVCERIGQRVGVAEAWHGIATAYGALGRYDEALALAERALVVELEHDRLLQRAEVMATIGHIYHQQGSPHEAVVQITEALALARESNNAAMIALVLNTLGEVLRDLGEHHRAIGHHQEAVDLAAGGGDRFEGARALAGLGDAHAGLADTERAESYWRQALDAYTDMNLPAAARLRTRLSTVEGS